MSTSKDLSETRNLERHLSRIGLALDQFVEFNHPDALQNASQWRSYLDQPLPQQGVGIEQITADICDCLIPNGSAVPKPGFTAFITTGATTASTLASTAASIASPQRYGLNAFTMLEELSLDWMAEMFNITPMKGIYSSGGSVANLIAMGGARQHAFERLGHDPAARGVNRAAVVYATRESHHTIQRALGVLGLGRDAVRLIDVDESGRMLPASLRDTIEADRRNDILPVAVIANAGSTNTGIIDPLRPIGEITREFGIWFHVDGAYGLPGILDPRINHLYKGLEFADSVIVDPHKWLGASVGIAATFVRDRDILYRAFTQEPADYLEGSMEQSDTAEVTVEHSMDSFGIPYFDFGVELSSPARGVVVWSLIREIGLEGMRQRIMRHNDMARHVAEFAHQHPNLEVLSEPVLSICCFRYVADGVENLDKLNQALCRQLIRENQHLPSTTRVKGKLAIRPCFVAARTNQDHVKELLQATLRIGKQLTPK